MTVRRSALKSYVKRSRRRTPSMATRFSKKKASARNNKRSVVSLARQVQRNSAIIRKNRVFCDFQYTLRDEPGVDQQFASGDWYCWPLTDPSTMEPCLRRDENVNESSATYFLRMQMNLRFFLAGASYAYWNAFIVTPRQNAIGRLDELAFAGPGQIDPLLEGVDYIRGVDGANLRLNPGEFRCDYARYITMAANTLTKDPIVDQNVSQTAQTYRKTQLNIPLKFRLRQPTGKTWRSQPFSQMARWEKKYLLVYVTWGGIPVGQDLPRMTFDNLYTTVNSF